MADNKQITPKEKLLLMVEMLSDNYARRVIDFIEGLRAGENLSEKKGA